MKEKATMAHLKLLLYLTICIPAAGFSQPAAPAEWTILIYMAADNDLEGPALVDLDEIEAGIPEQDVNVIVMIDRSSGYSEELGDWHDSRVLRLKPHRERGTVDLEELVRIGEVNTGDPKTLTEFIQYGLGQFPARRYGLIMWDHGGGWQSMASDDDLGNGDGHDSLTTPELSQALRAAVPPGFKFDLIGFDMCLMAQLEVAYEMAEFGKFMVASEAIEPGYGWPYHFLLPEFSNVQNTPRDLASNIVKRYGEYAENEAERVATQSAIDLSQIQNVKQSLDALSHRLIGSAHQIWPTMSRAMFWADSYEVTGKAENLERGKHAVASSDLLDIVNRMRASMDNQFPAEQEYRGLLDAIDAAVVENYTSRRHRLSQGIAIYAPPTAKNWNEEYLNLKASQGRWPGLLYAIHDQQQRNQQNQIQFKGMRFVKAGTMEQVTDSSMMDNTTLRLQIEGDNILWVTGVSARYSPEDKGHLVYNIGYLTDTRFTSEKLAASGSASDLLMPEFSGRSARMEMEVAPATFRVSNGEFAAFATLDGREAQSGASTHVSVQALYSSATEGQHLAVISFDLTTWEAAGIVLLVEQDDDQVTPRGVTPKPEDQLTLLYELIPDQGEPKLVKGETMAWKQGLELILDEVPNGTYTTFALAETLTGQQARANASVNVVDARDDIRSLIDGAKKLSIKDLGGIWSAEDTQVFAIGEPLEGSTSDAQLMINKEVIPEDMRENLFLARVENRLLPTLHLITFTPDGKTLLGREVFMLFADKSRPDTLFIKSMVGGEGNALGHVMEVTRTQSLQPEPGPGPGSNPAPHKPPNNPPNNSKTALVGIWEGKTSYSQVWVQMGQDSTYYQIDTSFDGSSRIETRGNWRTDGRLMYMQPTQAQQCNNWGCQPFQPEPIEPFPYTTNGREIRAEDTLLYRQQ